MIFAGPIWPSLAAFLMSLISFFSWRSSVWRSRSSSRTDLLIERLYSLTRSAGDFCFPNRNSTVPRREQAAQVVRRAGGARTGVCSRGGLLCGALLRGAVPEHSQRAESSVSRQVPPLAENLRTWRASPKCSGSSAAHNAIYIYVPRL